MSPPEPATREQRIRVLLLGDRVGEVAEADRLPARRITGLRRGPVDGLVEVRGEIRRGRDRVSEGDLALDGRGHQRLLAVLSEFADALDRRGVHRRDLRDDFGNELHARRAFRVFQQNRRVGRSRREDRGKGGPRRIVREIVRLESVLPHGGEEACRVLVGVKEVGDDTVFEGHGSTPFSIRSMPRRSLTRAALNAIIGR